MSKEGRVTLGAAEGTDLGRAVPAVPSLTRGWRCCSSSIFSRRRALCSRCAALFIAPQGVLVDDRIRQESFSQPVCSCCYVRSFACSCWNSPTRPWFVTRERTKCLQEFRVAGFREAFYYAYLKIVSMICRWQCSRDTSDPAQDTGASNSSSAFHCG